MAPRPTSDSDDSSIPNVSASDNDKEERGNNKEIQMRVRARNTGRAKWLRGLDAIRRPTPLYSGVGVLQLTVGMPPKKQTFVDLLSDSDDNGKNKTTNKGTAAAAPPQSTTTTVPLHAISPPHAVEPQTFYGLPAQATGQGVRSQLRYQIRVSNIGRHPSPAVGTRFDLSLLRDDLGGREADANEDAVQDYLAFIDVTTPFTFERAVQQYWLRDAATTGALLRGFPMMEEVAFFRAGNYRGAQSNCYWKAVAYVVYGHHWYASRVKAEHLTYFGEILERPDHPRHAYYTDLNRLFVPSWVTNQGKTITTRVNLYQQLTVPAVWTSDSMFTVTADLYNLFIVTYRVEGLRGHDATAKAAADGYVRAPIIYGSYNARHVFFLGLNGQHYQPMVPNDYYATEFQLPRPTFDSTYGYETTERRPDRAASLSTEHPWRRNNNVPNMPRAEGPTPVNVFYDKNSLRTVITGDPMEIEDES
ncbi:hypothetical protein M406DRAFT_328552 [Cryphonectria parasitica EP155]|uniref:OTU domain-containing protein n=1 Tax=Cryphonectria parasitica (strain ATCC 38755 / EP155) TaxID=660469 RepID=A0A9P4Y7F2_CRYP1|nr:uncharacterized protein M406DRAFT_328552 [Cryphonectria parasitica EP155]KAF3767475.1 hypothetical protein M406DRAFT_328552 [Cryphonectria parasitica EP155]